MGSDSPEYGRYVPEEERLNVYALVIYIPDPLGRFLDHLRRELVPAYKPHAHVSVLPPRPLFVDWQTADSQRTREKEKAISPAPKTAAAIAIMSPTATIDRRDASQTAPSNAPPPEAVIRRPSVCGPPRRMSPATIGISTP